MNDLIEQARNIRTLSYGEWLDVIDRTLFLTCCECGHSHEQSYRFTGPNMLRIRIDTDDTLTDAAREYNEKDYPLYREVLALREENAQLRAQLAEQSISVAAKCAMIR